MQIRHALARLDPEDEDLWTADGRPRLDAVSAMVGHPVKRAQIVEAAPDFTRYVAEEWARENPPLPIRSDIEEPEEEPEAEPEPEPEPNLEPDELEEPEPAGAVREMDLATVMRSPELLTRLVSELDDEAKALLSAKHRIEEDLRKIYAESEVASRQLSRIQGSDAERNQRGIREVLRKAREAREDRGRRLQAFVEAGVKPNDVLSALRPGSKIDQALNQRKASPGGRRPAPRVPAGR